MRYGMIFSVLAILGAGSLVSAATLTVDLSGGGQYTDIQSAIAAAGDGDTVLVKPGQYVIEEPIDFNRLHDPANPASSPVKNSVVESEGGPDVTTIRMSDTPRNPDRASVVIFENGETAASRLEGFTVTGGRGSLWREDEPSPMGGGVLCRFGAAPTLSRCVIRGNSAALSGGGVACWDASPTISDCTIEENSAESGGGLWVSYWSKPRVVRCLFATNGTVRGHGLVAVSGAGLASDSIELGVEASAFSGNSASESGGGAAISGFAAFVNCVFDGNRAAQGGGLSCAFGRAALYNCTFYANVAAGNGGGILCAIEGEVSVTGAIMWGDAAAQGKEIAVVDYSHGLARVSAEASDVEGGRAAIFAIPPDHVSWGRGTIDADPLFVAAGFWSDAGTPDDAMDDRWIPGDYHLQPISPCIDTGTSEGAPTTDIEGNRRPCWNGIDIGAYEYCGAEPPERLPQFKRGDANASGAVDIADAVFTLGYLFAQGVAPNCRGAADANDDGTIDIADAVKILAHLFAGAGPLPAPFGECGVDSTPDDLDCGSFSPCQGG